MFFLKYTARGLAFSGLMLANILLALVAVTAVFAWTHGGPLAVAQTVLTYLDVLCGSTSPCIQLSATDPTQGNDPNLRLAQDFNCIFNYNNIDSGYRTEACEQMTFTAYNGINLYSGVAPTGTEAKATFLPWLTSATYIGAGQKFIYGNTITCMGGGDCGIWGNNQVIYAGSSIGSDEGSASFGLDSHMDQQGRLLQLTISSVQTPSSCPSNMTLTQNVAWDQSGQQTPQTVTVSSSTGCQVGDWLIVDQTTLNGGDYGTPNHEAIQLTGVGSGTITAVFMANHASGRTVTPATVLTLNAIGDGVFWIGQNRKLVNVSTSSTYTAGTVSAITGGAFTGTGTSWATNMVGGSGSGSAPVNVGCIALDADTYTGGAQLGGGFGGTGVNGPLHSWYEITSVTNTGLMSISSFSLPSDTSYHGFGPGPSGSGASASTYIVRPCIDILRVLQNTVQVVAETTATTWTAGDTVEVAIAPAPSPSGFLYYMGQTTPGGAHLTNGNFLTIRNGGARTFSYGIGIVEEMFTGSNSDAPIGWDTAFLASGVNYGFRVSAPAKAAMHLDCGIGCGNTSDVVGRFEWGAGSFYMQPNSTDAGFDFQLDQGGPAAGISGFLKSYGRNSLVYGPGNSTDVLRFGGLFGTTPVTYSALPACSTGLIGSLTLSGGSGGSGYVNGPHTNVPLTGGAGSNATATITVSGGAVTAWTVTNPGQNYATSDSLSASNSNLGGSGSGLALIVSTLTSSEGLGVAISDAAYSATGGIGSGAFGATITGGGGGGASGAGGTTAHVEAYCNGTNWTVH